MTITIGTFESDFLLLQQPFGYEGNAQDGLTARKWTIVGLLNSRQAQSLTNVYNSWRNTRITDPDTFAAGSAGTTVSLTIRTPPVSVSAVQCWFTSPPKLDRVGEYTSVTVELVDAAQSVEVLLRTREKQRQSSDAEIPDFGNFIITSPVLAEFPDGGVTLKLIEAPDTYQDGPRLTLTPAGVHRVTGPLTATRVKNIKGYTDATGWLGIRTWYENVISSEPESGDLFPISEPTATAEVIIRLGVKATRYTVSLTLAEVR